jgi:hypothetical protein
MAGTLHMPLSFPSCQLIMKLIQSGFLVTSYLTGTNHEQCGRLRHQGYVMDYVEYTVNISITLWSIVVTSRKNVFFNNVNTNLFQHETTALC